MQTWTRENLAWLAGLLEGEGSFTLHKGQSPRVKLKMTDEDVVRRACEVAGFGIVYGPYKAPRADGGFNKDTWAWVLAQGHPCYALLVALLPWFGARRRGQVLSVLRTWLAWKRTNPTNGSPGEGNSQAVLTADIVLELRSKYAHMPRIPRAELRELGVSLGVTEHGLRQAIRGRSWRHLPM